MILTNYPCKDAGCGTMFRGCSARNQIDLFEYLMNTDAYNVF